MPRPWFYALRIFGPWFYGIAEWAPIALLIACFVTWPTVWGVLGGLVVFCSLWPQCVKLRQYLLVRNVPTGKTSTRITHLEFQGTPVDCLEAPFTDRVISQGREHGAGWISTWLLADGAIFDGETHHGDATDSPWFIYEDGRFIAAATDFEQVGECTVYDRKQHELLTLAQPNTNSISLLNLILDADLPDHENVLLRNYLATAKKQSMENFRGLWIATDNFRESAYFPKGPLLKLSRRISPEVQLDAARKLPNDLRTVVALRDLLSSSIFELEMNGIPTGRYVENLDEVFYDPTHAVLVIAGGLLANAYCYRKHVWHVHRNGVWHCLERYAGNIKGFQRELLKVISTDGEHLKMELSLAGDMSKIGRVDLATSWADWPICINSKAATVDVQLWINTSESFCNA